MFRPTRSATADGEAPLQSSEGLSIGVELTIRYALDPAKLASVGANLPPDIEGGLVDPLMQGVIYHVFTRYTVREIFSSKRQELQETIESELKPLLAQDGLILRQVMMGNVDLPADYRAGKQLERRIHKILDLILARISFEQERHRFLQEIGHDG